MTDDTSDDPEYFDDWLFYRNRWRDQHIDTFTTLSSTSQESE